MMELFIDTGPPPEAGIWGWDRYWRNQGYRLIAGTDEAGRGPLAGPVVAAAVIFPQEVEIPYLNDSKQLSERRRNFLFIEVCEKAIAVAWCQIEPAEIDKLNIYQASRLAMMKALTYLNQPVDLVLSDAMPLPGLAFPCIPIVHGDTLSASIAAASIIAKVIRDRIMTDMDLLYPQYLFGKHKGYGTQQHLQALQLYGPCAIHRRSFAPVKSWRASTDESS
jgi:ribonuclease HII